MECTHLRFIKSEMHRIEEHFSVNIYLQLLKIEIRQKNKTSFLYKASYEEPHEERVISSTKYKQS